MKRNADIGLFTKPSNLQYPNKFKNQPFIIIVEIVCPDTEIILAEFRRAKQ
jgi:hypothetical protein